MSIKTGPAHCSSSPCCSAFTFHSTLAAALDCRQQYYELQNDKRNCVAGMMCAYWLNFVALLGRKSNQKREKWKERFFAFFLYTFLASHNITRDTRKCADDRSVHIHLFGSYYVHRFIGVSSSSSSSAAVSCCACILSFSLSFSVRQHNVWCECAFALDDLIREMKEIIWWRGAVGRPWTHEQRNNIRISKPISFLQFDFDWFWFDIELHALLPDYSIDTRSIRGSVALDWQR